MVTTNAQAAELGRRARDELAALGLVAVDDLVELRDGNVAGVGDLIAARQNDRILAGEAGRAWPTGMCCASTAGTRSGKPGSRSSGG